MISSIISLDLGGKYTGFFSFTSNSISNIDDFQSGTIIYDESFGLSQVIRRGKRHTKRNNLRNKLVKRLFLLILQKHYGLKIDFLPDEILGLFNKRGYTYASFEIKENEKEELESGVLKEFLNEKLTDYPINSDDEVEEFLNQIASNETIFKNYKNVFENLFTTITHQPKKQLELKEEIKSEYEKDDAKELLNGLKMVKKIIDEFDKQQNQGNLPRAKYFSELNSEIEQNLKIQEFFKTYNLQILYIQNLIANLSNYQLKELRRYFNDENMKNGDIWNEEKLHKITWRFIQSWHPKNDEDKQRQKDNLKELKSKKIIEFFTTTNPIMTIPPYDDMNNRGAVKCQSLRLNEEYLDIHLANWRNITFKLSNQNQKENLDISTIKGWGEDSTLFHRILDTSKEIDSYKLRSNKIDAYIDILGKEDSLALQKFTKNYYELIRLKVRTGIWTKDDKMFKKCKHNPSYKNNQIHNLIAGILGVKIEADKFTLFEKELWNIKFGNKKLVSYCKNIEELRKSHGNLFKLYIEELTKKEPKELSKEEKSDFNLLLQSTLYEWTNKIGDFFGIEEKYRARFNNHFSMAQLYTIIETKRSGFNSTCKWCTAENQYRTTTSMEINQETGEVFKNANAQRLPADTQRPFSGKIERYIDKLGYEIAKVKAKEIENIEGYEIKLQIVLEQNAFEYEESIRSAKIKNANKKANESLKKSKESFDNKLKDKTKRIKDFINGICPYCGENLGEEGGEIDHILPRSYTLKFYDTVFNSEGNLLYVHQKCNQAKKETIYKLNDIKAPITKEEIEKIINPISKNSYKTFTALTPEQQKAFKYALFLDKDNEAYQRVINWLRTDQSSRVNGTQKYLAKKIQEKLKLMLPNKKFDFEFILADANDIHDLREKYAKENELLKKPEIQPPSSHTIDAIMAFLSVYPKIVKQDELPSVDKVINFANLENWSALENEILTKGKSTNQKIEEMIGNNNFSQKSMREVFSKAIFKDESIGERYKPIVQYQNRFYIGYPKTIKNGYDIKYCQEIISKNDILKSEKIIENKDLSNLSKDNNYIKIYSINKQTINELSNDFFNFKYASLDETEKEKTSLIEFIINNCKYYVKKTSVINAPQFLNKESMKPFPFYDDWQRFHESYKKELGYEPKTKKDNGKFVYDISGIDNLWIEFCKKYFNIKTKDNRNKARKVFSIIALTSAPGTVFRIKRKTPKGYIYQATAIDNQQIAGDYANILLKANCKSLALAGQKPSQDLKKELTVKQSKDIRDIKLEPSKIFNVGFDCNDIEVILNKTSATIKKFPLSYFKKEFVQNIELFESELKSTLNFVKNTKDFGVIKTKLDAILKMTTRSDGVISKINIHDNSIDFVLPYKNTSKLLDD